MTRVLHEHIVVSSRHSAVKFAEHKLKSVLDRINITASQEHNLLVAASEAVSNAVVHGNKNDPKKKVLLDVNYDEREITVEVQDEGRGFNPTNVPDPLLPENLMKPSGRGIHIMKSLMDKVKFEFTPKGTRTIMKLKLGKTK
ncbi:MAG TPA: ATP-binding protein [Candidatus Acidoferrales bacterium]|nr:ATP-binding protein [Candidatus Acidoferrales bacterium]